ncbi:hypothetical protein BGZ68_001412 [Mortierella alpina]|nr:hypothetical protein BGZ68_001412 [Mortierella alpina]
MARKEDEPATAADYAEYEQMVKEVRAKCARPVAKIADLNNKKPRTSRRLTRSLKTTTRKETEAAEADDEEYKQMLKDAEAKCKYWAAMNTQWSSSKTAAASAPKTNPHTSRHPMQPLEKISHLEEGEYGAIGMEAKEKALLKECEKLERQLTELKRETKDIQESNRRRVLAQPPPAYGHGSQADHSNDRYRRSAGKRLTEEERRAVLHCFQTCDEENRTRMVSTAGPLERTAYYLGIDADMVQAVVSGIKHRD